MEGDCSASLKFMPHRPGEGREALAWMWGVVRAQGLGLVYGLSPGELYGRAETLGLDYGPDWAESQEVHHPSARGDRTRDPVLLLRRVARPEQLER